uniref:Uncharacterized protein n=1 Tax=Anguilla anguilla TaxID=7936 RepID=A0A0E9VR12_ANGAN
MTVIGNSTLSLFREDSQIAEITARTSCIYR